jgi:uncharacterized protein
MEKDNLLAEAERAGQHIIAHLRQNRGILVAFSGGVDSTLLLSFAQEALPGKVLAVTAVSEMMSRKEYGEIEALARQMGVPHRFVETADLAQPEIAANSRRRCYYCKRHRFLQMQALAEQLGCDLIVEGSNRDDLDHYRPGYQAVQELGIQSPLLQFGLTKAMVRRLAQARGLAVWNKPSAPCLATRLPYDTPLTREALAQIEAGEELLRQHLGEDAVFRLRSEAGTARLEADPSLFPQLREAGGEGLRPDLAGALLELGFHRAILDPEGYRSGSYDLSDRERKN